MSTNTLKNRVLSVLLVLVMVVSMLPIQVLGADGGAATVITSGGEVAFNVYKDAVAYANQHDGSTIKLQSDIEKQIADVSLAVAEIICFVQKRRFEIVYFVHLVS